MVEELDLKVAEAMQIDYGKRVVRVDSSARKMLGVTTGDVVEIKGKKTTAAIVFPAHPADEGLNLIRMDGILRQNASVGLGDKIRVRKAEIKPAKKIVLAPNQPTRYAPGFDQYVKKNLLGKPLQRGDVLSVNVFGTAFPFAVAQTVPTGLTIVVDSTALELREEPMKELGRIATISYEDVGGMKEDIKKVREMVELPMRHPELFERLGIEPPKGILLYGPPGTGKTLLAKAVANESDAHFLTIAGPEVISKFVGEAEERLRQIFADAEENAPSIIFIDELDAIAPKRDEVVGEVEKRIVGQMLALMDGLKSRGKVIVIAASVTGDTPILIKNEEGTRLTSIGEFVDKYYSDGEEGIEKPLSGVKALGFDSAVTRPFGNTCFKNSAFKNVRGVFRHKVNEIYEIDFVGGKIRTTGNHSVFVRTKQGVEPKPVSELVVGECLVDLPFKARPESGAQIRSHAFLPYQPIKLQVYDPRVKQVWRAVQAHQISTINAAAATGISVGSVRHWATGSSPKLLKTVLAQSIPEEVEVTPQLMRLFGYYAAEGYARKEVDFCFGTHEKDLITDLATLMKRVFGADAEINVTGTRTNVIYYAKLLANFFARHVGKGASNKHVPPFLFELPKEFLVEFLRGYLNGDGYKGSRGWSATSTSKQLIMELNWLCRMHGIKSFMAKTVAKAGRTINGGKPLAETIAYRLTIGKTNDPFEELPVSHTNLKKPYITAIKKLSFDGYVYDLCGCDNEAFFGGQTPILLHNTNRPNSLDPALRRPGRFDREIEIGAPDKKGRKEILQIHTRGMPLDNDVSLDEFASVTHGFVGADLQSLCKEAAMRSLRRILPKIDLEKEIPQEILDDLKVTKSDFHNALREIQPSALREVYVEVPNVKWEQIGGLDEAKREIKEAVELPLKHPEAFKRMGIRPVRGILLYGPPGTGKTLLAKAVATESEANFIAIRGPELLNKWVGDSLAYDEPVVVVENGVTKLLKIGELEQELSKNNTNGQIQLQKLGLMAATINDGLQANSSQLLEVIRHPAPSHLYKIKTATGREIKTTRDHALFALHEGKLKEIEAGMLVPGESAIAIPSRIDFGLGATPEFNLVELLERDPHVFVEPNEFVSNAIRAFGVEKFTQAAGFSDPEYVAYRNSKGKLSVPISSFVKASNALGFAYDAGKLRLFARGSPKSMPGKITLDENWAFLLGIWTAEGDYNSASVRIHNQNAENRERIRQACSKIGIDFCETKNAIIICSHLIQSIFGAIGARPYAEEKRVPPIVFGLPRASRAAFLSGYYSGDGSVYGSSHRFIIEASTASPELACDLMYLLLGFGIVATHYVQKDKRGFLPKNKVQFSFVDNFRKFQEIGFSDAKRNKRVADYIASKKWERSHQIPMDGFLRKFVSENGMPEWINSASVGKKKLLELANKVTGAKDKLKDYLALPSADVYWDKVVSVEKIPYDKPFVYDLSVNQTQRFIGGFGGLLVHNSERGLREIFRKARQAAPAIIFFDEIDAIAPGRGGDEGHSHVMDNMVNTLLAEMDGLQNLKDVVVIGATNRADIIDRALLRPGRFDKLVWIPAPDEKARLEILKVQTKGMKLAKNVNLSELSKRTDGYSGADIEGLCREAAMVALRESLSATEVENKHFEKALKEIGPTLVQRKQHEEIAGYS